MKYVFFGSPEFASIILEKLVKASLPLAAVVCNPDRPAGRKKIITPPPVKITAQKYGIEVLQPDSVEAAISQLKSYQADVFIVAAYSKILPLAVISLPRLGTIGVHPSLLPKHRGATPIQTAILNGDTETGTSLFLMDQKIDHGPILTNAKLPVADGDTYEILMEKLAGLSADLLAETLPKFINGEVRPAAQNESQAIYTKKFGLEDAYVDLEKNDAAMIMRKIRALNPEPGVWTIKGGKRIKILEAELRGGQLILKKIQEAGKKPAVL